MSNSYARQIYRSESSAEALQVVAGLLALPGVPVASEVDLDAHVSDAGTLEQLCQRFSGFNWWRIGRPSRESVASWKVERLPGPDDLPLHWSSWGRSAEDVREYLDIIGASVSTVRWDLREWPPVPEIGLEAGGERGAHITLCVNVLDLYMDEREAGFSVFVHAKYSEARRIEWLAEAVGCRATGELVEAPV